jgi:hypothetical protein
MHRRITRHIRSNVVGYLALFVALSGTAYAVDGPLPGQNQVGSADIINNDVQSADIKDANVTNLDLRSNAVTAGKILDGEVSSADVQDNSLTASDINESTLPFVSTANVQHANFAANAGGSGAALSLGGLTILANCHSPSRDLQWFLESDVDNATVHMSWSVVNDSAAKTLAINDFDSGVAIDPFPANTNDDQVAGTLVYTRPDGGSVSLDYQMEDSEGAGAPQALGGTKDCLLSGVAVYQPGP